MNNTADFDKKRSSDLFLLCFILVVGVGAVIMMLKVEHMLPTMPSWQTKMLLLLLAGVGAHVVFSYIDRVKKPNWENIVVVLLGLITFFKFEAVCYGFGCQEEPIQSWLPLAF